MSESIERLERVEYLAEVLVQKLRDMRHPMEDFFAQAYGFGLEYTGPDCDAELDDLFYALKGTE